MGRYSDPGTHSSEFLKFSRCIDESKGLLGLEPFDLLMVLVPWTIANQSFLEFTILEK